MEAKKIDLFTYLQNYEPQELVRFSGNAYCTRTHGSLKISNGKWCWDRRPTRRLYDEYGNVHLRFYIIYLQEICHN